MQNEKLKLLAKDLTKEYPRSPRETLGGYVIAARTLDKCRAALNGTLGEYKFDCALDRRFLEFAGITAEQFRSYVESGATDAEVGEWIRKTSKARPNSEIVQWCNQMRELKISQIPVELQEYLETYIPKFVPKNRPVYCWFDVYDLEEERI